ncbi:uncharacterized protein LOC129748583 isoform X2 [Uranotaenia lowii]|uniref:uncharacterized protein LOC129748583 isoform X2 n=1 Tax=Uranotaenia lowii TaxID=190385 RepID=UPI0024798FD8|nr:uncharacterized protein LOC129748583 isoform X2 [Uranotaenia lowii]
MAMTTTTTKTTKLTPRSMPRCVAVIVLVLALGLFQGPAAVDSARTTFGGLVAPIEVIEEWGCYDTEIRLTCASLESRVAILEAKFVPRCTEERPEDCVHVDEQSLAQSYAARKVDKLTLEEREAGQRFLQTLRRNHEHKQQKKWHHDGSKNGETMPTVEAVQSSPVPSGGFVGSPAAGPPPANGTTSIVRVNAKDKRSSLRATLEHLIVRYLRRITTDGEDEEEDEIGGYESTDSVRYRRQAALLDVIMNGTSSDEEEQDDNGSFAARANVTGNEGPDSLVDITLLTNDSDIGNDSSMTSASSRSSDWGREEGPREGEATKIPTSTSESAVTSVLPVSAAEPVVVDEKSSKLVIGGGGGGKHRHKGHKKPECTSIRKRISQLDRFELEKSMQNDSLREYNIRNALNYRCSGKNHCSFVFSQDHPFAVVWREGTVRVKYICMDDFRISKYCDEHLIIGNERRWEKRRKNQHQSAAAGGNRSTSGTSPRDVSVVGSDAVMAGTGDVPREGSLNDTNKFQQQRHQLLLEVPRDRNYYGDNVNDPVSFTGDRNQWSYDGGGQTPQDDVYYNGEDYSEEQNPDDGYGDAYGTNYGRNGNDGADDDYGDVDDDQYNDVPAGEPRVEAVIQQQPRQQFRQMRAFHNLKILKTFPSETAELPVNETENQQRPPSVPAESSDTIDRKRQKVFSQDFRVLKILPSNLDQVEDIKQIGNEYFFKKDIEVVDDAENEIASDIKSNATNNQFTETLDIVVLPPPTKDSDVYDNEEFEDVTPDGIGTRITTSNAGRSSQLLPSTPTTIPSGVQSTHHYTENPSSKTPIDVSPTSNLEPKSTISTLGPPTLTSTRGVAEIYLEAYPDLKSNEIEGEDGERPNKSIEASAIDESSFSFNNKTFRKMMEGIHGSETADGRQEENEEDDSEDDVEEEDDYDEEDEEDGYPDGERRGHKKYISIQRTLLKHPLRQGFLMTPGYPKYYIGDSVCRWTLYAQRHQKIRLTILDLALRFDEPCRDYVEIRDLNTNQTLFSSCAESTRPIVVVSAQERVEVNVRTTTKVAYPKRGVLIHYSEKRATEGSGLVSHYEQKRKISDLDEMSDKKADTIYDILIPSLIIAALFIVNGIVFAVIMRYRNRRKQRLELDSKELAEL